MGLMDEIAAATYEPDKTVFVSRTDKMTILPSRDRRGSPHNTIALNYAAREAGDCFYRCAVEITKLFYIKIDNRYSAEMRENPKHSKYHSDKMLQAKRILQEHRNDVFDCVLPMFVIGMRRKDDTEYTEADNHAQDLFVKNLFYMLVKTYDAWIPEFVEEEDVETTREVLKSIALAQTDKLSQQLRNFTFEYRPLKVL